MQVDFSVVEISNCFRRHCIAVCIWIVVILFYPLWINISYLLKSLPIHFEILNGKCLCWFEGNAYPNPGLKKEERKSQALNSDLLKEKSTLGPHFEGIGEAKIACERGKWAWPGLALWSNSKPKRGLLFLNYFLCHNPRAITQVLG